MKLVAFTAASKKYAVNIKQVHEVIRMREITAIPGAAGFVEGIINLRGRIITVIRLGKKHGLQKLKLDKKNRIIIAKLNSRLIGVIVDEVSDVISLKAGDITPPDEALKKTGYLIGMAKTAQGLILILDLKKLLLDKEKTQPTKSMEEMTQSMEEPTQSMEEMKLLEKEKAAENESVIMMQAEESELIDRQKNKKKVRVLSFSLGEENYCIDIKSAKETVKLSRITTVPNAPKFIVGVINLRGEIISLIDIGYFFGLNKLEKKEAGKVIISDINGPLTGVLVDKIKNTLDIEQDLIQSPLASIKESLATYTKGQVQLDKEILIFLDLKKLLGCEQIKRLKTSAE